MTRFLFLALLPLAAAPAPAATAAATQRVSTLVVYGNDPCPAGAPDEVVVCARQPESERYRIPKRLRAKPYNAARDGSWAGTAKVVDAIGQEGLPGSCSPNGSAGQVGCFQRFVTQANAERAAAQAAEPSAVEPR